MNNILIDAYKIKDLNSGLGQFSLNFANQLIIQKPPNSIIDILIPKGTSSRLIESNSQISFINAGFQKRYFPVLNDNYSVWHSLHQFPSFFPKKKTVWILTIHDLNFLHEKNVRKSDSYLKRLQKNIDRADYVTAISNYTKNEIENHLNLKGKSVQVIYNGIAPNIDTQNIKPDFIGSDKFFFSIGIFNKKKNFHTLLPVMKYFSNHKLIIAGNTDTSYGKEIQNQINDLNLQNQIILPGKISESDKYWLYNNCDAFLFPSLAEGFGMPVIEAMKAGKPVFISKHSSLPEIGGDIAFYFDNFDEIDMSNLIKTNLNAYNKNPDLHILELKKYSEKFSWNNCIKEYIKLYEQI